MQNSKNTGRPLSPHLSIYRLQITSALSIMHRLTGIALFISISIISWCVTFWILSNFSTKYLDIMKSWYIKLLITITIYALIYHMLNGIRHLLWDISIGFSNRYITISGILIIILSILLTITFGYCILI
ncbi:succinate dehydrogenase, cytochrome b556 subunit [Rickettsia endosymbiont of Cardiosporidium cionae]|uniref:succinate dehydrogenase, cytochrome b556 subunit n=1 Tax=Rickettsia endosymbiont of Cardiosporidium cionae TaxID=2777155 RepID=UPI001892F6D0|nr:succinate dehydrogenase, cytochrome b556 subunit [Rickettsia endosymbiont of Cardiosporidium cionae]KAF8818401.1 succinate dehydrogenase, cytochrome b556 subunit [Rickettsia endosymbiont of Cardiosporidium cionae]